MNSADCLRFIASPAIRKRLIAARYAAGNHDQFGYFLRASEQEQRPGAALSIMFAQFCEFNDATREESRAFSVPVHPFGKSPRLFSVTVSLPLKRP